MPQLPQLPFKAKGSYEPLQGNGALRMKPSSPSSPGKDEESALAGCFGLLDEGHAVRYVFVGEHRGHYEQSLRGNFHFVGPNHGHFEKEIVPPARLKKALGAAGFGFASLAAIAFVAVTVKHCLAREVAFNCAAGLENAAAGWSDMKRQYCCENEGVGCSAVPLSGGDGKIASMTEASQSPPHWLDLWLEDMALGPKFVVSGLLALLLGCCCGASLYLRHLQGLPERRDQSEAELLTEMNRILQRLGAKSGELSVTLMWDTGDDLDLHLTLPGQRGEISAACPALAGGRLDIDGNYCLAEVNTRPVENIYWPELGRNTTRRPPVGEYTVWVKVFEKRDQYRDANVTIVKTVSGEKEVFHLRIPPGRTEAKVCSFHYPGPAGHLASPRSRDGSPDGRFGQGRYHGSPDRSHYGSPSHSYHGGGGRSDSYHGTPNGGYHDGGGEY